MAHSPIIEYVAIQFAITNLMHSVSGIRGFYDQIKAIGEKHTQEQAQQSKKAAKAYVDAHMEPALRAKQQEKISELSGMLPQQEREAASAKTAHQQRMDQLSKYKQMYNAANAEASKMVQTEAKLLELSKQMQSITDAKFNTKQNSEVAKNELEKLRKEYQLITGNKYGAQDAPHNADVVSRYRFNNVTRDDINEHLANNQEYQRNAKALKEIQEAGSIQDWRQAGPKFDKRKEGRLDSAVKRTAMTLEQKQDAYNEDPSDVDKHVALRRAREAHQLALINKQNYDDRKALQSLSLEEIKNQQTMIENDAQSNVVVERLAKIHEKIAHYTKMSADATSDANALLVKEQQIKDKIAALDKQKEMGNVHNVAALDATIQRERQVLATIEKERKEKEKLAHDTKSYLGTLKTAEAHGTVGLRGVDRQAVMKQVGQAANQAANDMLTTIVPASRYLGIALSGVGTALTIGMAAIVTAAKFSMDEFQKLEKPAMELSAITGMSESKGFSFASVLGNFGINAQSFANQFEQMSTRIMTQPAMQQVMAYRLGLNPNNLVNQNPMDMLKTIDDKIKEIPNLTMQNAMRTKIMGVELGDAMRIMGTRDMERVMGSASKAYSPEYIDMMRSMTMEWQIAVFEFKAVMLPVLKTLTGIAVSGITTLNSLFGKTSESVSLDSKGLDVDQQSVSFLKSINGNTEQTAMGVNAMTNDIRSMIKMSTANNRPSLYGRVNWEFGFLTNTTF